MRFFDLAECQEKGSRGTQVDELMRCSSWGSLDTWFGKAASVVPRHRYLKIVRVKFSVSEREATRDGQRADSAHVLVGLSSTV